MNSPWAKLPNAHHIEWVLEILKQNPQLWVEVEVNAAGDEARHTALHEANVMTKTTVNAAARAAAWAAARAAAWAAARDAAWDAARDTAWDAAVAAEAAAWAAVGVAAEDAVKYVLWDAVKDSVWDAIVVLVAYNDCEQYINMGYEKLLMYAKLSEKPQAILLLPMVYVREKLGIETVENNTISI